MGPWGRAKHAAACMTGASRDQGGVHKPETGGDFTGAFEYH